MTITDQKIRTSFWKLVEEAEREVATWPAWKRRAAERVFVTELDAAPPSV
jgi:hypothetical protein